MELTIGKRLANIDSRLRRALALITKKQDTITDLATIRSGATAGSTAYQRPAGGIPKEDLDSAVHTSLGAADTALQSGQKKASLGGVSFDDGIVLLEDGTRQYTVRITAKNIIISDTKGTTTTIDAGGVTTTK